MDKAPIISCSNVSLTIGNKKLLEDVSFSLIKNENLAVFGPNGAGKTLLVRILSGNFPPTNGTVMAFGKPLFEKESYLVKKRIGFVSPSLFEDFSGEDKVIDVVMSGFFGSIGVGGALSKQNGQVVKKYIQQAVAQKYDKSHGLDLLERVHIAHLSKVQFDTLSYGEKIRVFIARALIHNPPLLILDEPTTGLDLGIRAEFSTILTELAKHAQIIFVTHHLEEIPAAFQKVLLIKQGKIFKIGAKSSVLTSDNLTSLLGRPVTVVEHRGNYSVHF